MNYDEIHNRLRRLYAALPTALHWIVAWLTGQAPPGQRPRPRWPWTAKGHLALYFSVLLAAGAASIYQLQGLADAAATGMFKHFN